MKKLTEFIAEAKGKPVCEMCEKKPATKKINWKTEDGKTESEHICASCHHQFKRDNKLHTAHIKEIEKHYGKERAAKANIGWGSDTDHIESKVYGDRTMIVSSNHLPSGKITHDHSEY